MRDDYRAGEVEILKADGGASQNNLLLQIQADHLQVHCTALHAWHFHI
jgi:glycerol kinase